MQGAPWLLNYKRHQTHAQVGRTDSMHRDEDAKDDADERREKRGLQKDAEAGGRKQSLR